MYTRDDVIHSAGNCLRPQSFPVLCPGCSERRLRFWSTPVLPGGVGIKFVPDSSGGHLPCTAGPAVDGDAPALCVPLHGDAPAETAAQQVRQRVNDWDVKGNWLFVQITIQWGKRLFGSHCFCKFSHFKQWENVQEKSRKLLCMVLKSFVQFELFYLILLLLTIIVQKISICSVRKVHPNT